MVFPATIPLSAFALDMKSLASPTSSDPMDLIIRAMQAATPAEAHALLEQAKTQIASENLDTAQVAALEAMIASADSRIAAQNANFGVNKSLNLPLGLQAASGAVAGAGAGAAKPPQAAKPAAPIDTDAIIAKLIASNPDLRQTMRELNQARIERDVKNPVYLEEVVKQATGISIAKQDENNAKLDAAANDVDALIKGLQGIPYLFKNYSADNAALISAHPEIPIDDLAQTIINDKKWESAAFGAAERVLNASGFSTKIKIAGVSVDAIGQFVVNANLILRLTDLYGVKLDESQQRIVIMMCIAGGKYGLFAGKRIQQVQALADNLGDISAHLFWRASDATLGRVWALILRAKFMQTLVAQVQSLSAQAKASAGVKAAGEGAAAAVAGEAKAEVAQAAENGAAQAAEQEAKNAAEQEAKNVAQDIDTPLSATQVRKMIPSVLWGGARAYYETWWIGYFTRNFLNSKRLAERKLETKDFQAFMAGDRGIGVTKLLIAALNAQKQPRDIVDAKTTRDPQARFILNLNLSAKVCSADQFARYNQLTKAAADAEAKKTTFDHVVDAIKRARAALAANLLNQPNLNDRDYEILRFACDSTLGSSRYDQMAEEFVTFNAIPDWEAAAVRASSYANRIRVGEMLMQFQFLRGDPDEKAKIFFNTTITKVLGLTRPEDADYFENFYSFIRLHGGMHEDPSSPTGFSIQNVIHVNPWDEVVGYTVSGGPAVPMAPVGQVAAPAPAPAVAPNK